MTETEVAVIGAGPAGLCAAIEAAKHKCRTLLFDENETPGGQLVKQIHKFFGSKDHKAAKRGFEIGFELQEEAASVGVGMNLKSTVFGIFENNIIGVLEDGKAHAVKAKQIIISTGASEKAIVFPGWTLPGVMGAGAVQTMVNLHRVLPGKKALMIGSGNVGLIVSYQLLQAGAQVVAVIESKEQIGGYEVHSAKIRRACIPILTSCTIKRAQGLHEVESAVIAKVNREGVIIPDSEEVVDVDLICLAVGLSPLAELAWMAGCKSVFLPELGGYIPVHDENMKTTMDNIYVAGDVSGVEEASTAMEEGRMAGISVAGNLDYLDKLHANEMKSQISYRLNHLRKGPFGDIRYGAKSQIFRMNKKELKY